MLNDYLSHTDREEDWIQGFQNLMEYKNNYRKLMPLFDLLHCLLYHQHLSCVCLCHLYI